MCGSRRGPGATVSVNGQPQGRTPLELRLARKGKDQVIRIESPGYDPVEIRPRRKLAGHFVLGNALVGVAVGLVPTFFWMLRNDDVPTHGTPYLIWSASAAAVGALLTVVDIGGPGKGYEWSPADLEVTLKKTDGTPRVRTIVVEAPDLGSIRWIRVGRD